MHNRHAWTERTEDGEKREIRAEKFGKVWKIQAKLRSEPKWTYYDQPTLHDLLELKDNLERKYQRRRASYEDVQSVELLIRDARRS